MEVVLPHFGVDLSSEYKLKPKIHAGLYRIRNLGFYLNSILLYDIINIPQRNKCSLDPAKKKPLRLNADDNSNSGSTTSVTNGSRTTPSNNGDDAEKVTAVEKGSAESSDSNETNQAIPETEEEEKTVYKPFTGRNIISFCSIKLD